jgi:hypothetical protein
MTLLSAKVVNVGKQVDQCRVIVHIGKTRYRGSFNTLKFGDNKPFIGSCNGSQLDLLYHKDPGLAVGQSFPLWSIQ